MSTSRPPTTPDLERALHDLAHADLAPPRFDSADVAYVVHDTVIGPMLLAATEDGRLVASAFTPTDAVAQSWVQRLAGAISPRVLRLPARLDAARREVDDFLAGRVRRFDVPVDLTLATDFQRQVLGRLVDTVAYGERSTYGGLASALGRPTASRAVGAALGANPLCVVLPCHRVVSSSGALTGYAGGLEAKRYLLQLEASAAGERRGRGWAPGILGS